MSIQSFDDLIDQDYLNEVLNPAESFSVEQLVQSKINNQLNQGNILELESFKSKSVGDLNLPDGLYFYIDPSGNKKLSRLGIFYECLSQYKEDYSAELLDKLLLAASNLYVDYIYADRAYHQNAFLDSEIHKISGLIAGLLEIRISVARQLLAELGRVRLKFENYSIYRKRAEYERLESRLRESKTPQSSTQLRLELSQLKGLSLNKENNQLLLLLVRVTTDAFLSEL